MNCDAHQSQSAHAGIRFYMYTGLRTAGERGGGERRRIIQGHDSLCQTQRKQLRKVGGRRISQYQDMRTASLIAQLFGLIQV